MFVFVEVFRYIAAEAVKTGRPGAAKRGGGGSATLLGYVCLTVTKCATSGELAESIVDNTTQRCDDGPVITVGTMVNCSL